LLKGRWEATTARAGGSGTNEEEAWKPVEMRAAARDSGSYRLWRWQAAARASVMAWTPTDGGGGLLQLVAATAYPIASGGGETGGRSTQVRRQRATCCRSREAGRRGRMGDLHVRGTRPPVRRGKHTVGGRGGGAFGPRRPVRRHGGRTDVTDRNVIRLSPEGVSADHCNISIVIVVVTVYL
jgi:hypothetical protein